MQSIEFVCEGGKVTITTSGFSGRGCLDATAAIKKAIGLRVEAFASATELLQHPLPAVPSCLVLDIRLPRLSGFDLQAELNRLGIKIPIIFITGHGDVPMSVKAMKAGAIDFLIKPVREQEMLDAVTGALERDRKRRAEEKSNSDARARFALLTPRERQIMALVTGGLMNKQVAGKIGISERTVKIHRGNVMRKMHVKSLADGGWDCWPVCCCSEFLGCMVGPTSW